MVRQCRTCVLIALHTMSSACVLHVLCLQVEQRLQAKEAEVQELMGMCDQLLQQQEARGG